MPIVNPRICRVGNERESLTSSSLKFAIFLSILNVYDVDVKTGVPGKFTRCSDGKNFANLVCSS